MIILLQKMALVLKHKREARIVICRQFVTLVSIRDTTVISI
jgi:hypothetical protein